MVNPRAVERRIGVAAAGVGLVAFIAQGWVPRMTSPGGESDRATTERLRSLAAAGAGAAGLAAAEDAGIDVDEVIDTVRHNVAPVPGRRGTLEAGDDAYRARFRPEGFALSLGADTLGISVRGVSRGERAFDVEPGAWRGEANVARRALAHGLVEQVSARTRELEWDLVLAVAPPGRGALRVEAEVAGARDATRLDRALHFTLADGGQPVRMGEVVVKDATGAELYRALPTVTDTRLALEVPDSVLDRAAYPLTIDPTVGPELPVTGPPPLPGAQTLPTLAFDGTNYLVVWEDIPNPTSPSPVSDVLGARVSAAGAILDPDGVIISAATDIQGAPAVAFDGTNYLVSWVDDRSGTNDVYGARVSTAGALLDGPPDTGGIAISTAPDTQGAPALAFDGTNYLVVWPDFRSGTADIYGARVSPAGALLDGPPDTGGIAISTAANAQQSPAVAFDGTNFLVTWADARAGAATNIVGARVSTAGSLVDGPPDTGGIAISTAANFQSVPALTFDGTNYLVAWADARSGTNDIVAARVSPAGALLDGPPATGGIAVSTAANAQHFPAVAFDGTNALIVWRDSRGGGFDIFGARVTTAGSLLDGPSATGGIPISTAVNSQQFPAVAFDGTNYLVAWSDNRSVADDIYGARVSTAGTMLDGPAATGGIIISIGAEQRMPAVAFDGTNFLVVWSDFRSGARFTEDEFPVPFAIPDLFGARVSPGGEILDPTGILIATRVVAGQTTLHGLHAGARVAFDGTNYLVVWDNEGARVSTAGVLLDPVPIQISDTGGTPAVAFDGTNYLVAWHESSGNRIVGARVSTDGTVLDPEPIEIGIGGNSLLSPPPAIAFDGTNYLVVWAIGLADSDTYGARVSPAGTVLDPETIDISTAAGVQTSPSVAFDGTRYLVVWRDDRSGSDDIYGTRVSTAGTLLDGPPDTGGFPISTAPNDQEYPAVAANGAFLVVWNDRRSGNYETFGARVNGGNGAVQDPSGFVIATSNFANQPGVTARPGGWAVTYTAFDTTYAADRVFLRTVAPK